MKYFVAILIFFSGALTSSVFEWQHEITTVEILNTSNQPVRHIDIRLEGSGQEMNGRIAKGLKSNSAFILKWVTQSEASFDYVVTFDDGHQVFRSSTYTSRGRKVIDEISDHTITEKTTDMLHTSTTLNVTKHE
ncbi:hypothetical protein [Limnohabitans sp. B9-3]|uniref:hypothetical protein n=1 Tax=Limnohabitans sp. B9-3 TaxID=1100707 RepID=UPI000C1E9643|nr:hypothetical protein [Limnohabitans sp. B9-3]PIT71366.1 hypothetical protein B9Z42_15620 [Limnohabitans sp. B9-3]